MLLSLFSGCGGLDLGFERAGFEIGLSYDIRPSAVASWNRNRPQKACSHVADLATIRLRDIDRHYGAKFVPSGVIGGPPCQSFSLANRSPRVNDPRSKLVRRFFTLALRFHRERRPLDFILLENVPRLATIENGRLLAREVERLEQHGFDVPRFLADAADHTVPQFRKRLFVLVLPKNTPATKLWRQPVGTSLRKTVVEAIGGLPSPVYFRRDLNPEEIPFHPNHWCMNPRSPRFHNGSLVEGDSSARSFKTLAWRRPSITASYGHREVHVHPTGTRRLSVFEAMRLQGFPDNYVLDGTLSAQIDQVSEAVPPPLAEAIALSINSALPSTPETESVAAYAQSFANTLRG